MMSIRGYIILDLDKNDSLYDNKNFTTLHLNENKIYPRTEESRTVLIRFLNSLQYFFEAGTDENGHKFVMETIGYKSIIEIIFEYIKYPVTSEFINVFSIVLELLAYISGSDEP